MFRQASSSTLHPAGHGPSHDEPTLPICTICVQRKREWTAVILRGELDLFATQELIYRIRIELAREKPVLVELAGLEFVDLNGVRALAGLMREGARCEAGVELHGDRGQVRRMLQCYGAASTKRAE